jgi:hypothetical protein
VEEFWGASVMYSGEKKEMEKSDRVNLSNENYVN